MRLKWIYQKIRKIAPNLEIHRVQAVQVLRALRLPNPKRIAQELVQVRNKKGENQMKYTTMIVIEIQSDQTIKSLVVLLFQNMNSTKGN